MENQELLVPMLTEKIVALETQLAAAKVLINRTTWILTLQIAAQEKATRERNEFQDQLAMLAHGFPAFK